MAVLVAGLLLLSQVEGPPNIPAQVFLAAEEANVSPLDLHAALLTVGEEDPRRYLQHTGQLAPPAPPPPPTPSYAYRAVWDLLASCESSGNWASVSNPRYKGGLQMDATFWANYGGLAFAPAPHLATKLQQITVAERGLAVQGWGAWPACSRRLGLR